MGLYEGASNPACNEIGGSRMSSCGNRSEHSFSTESRNNHRDDIYIWCCGASSVMRSLCCMLAGGLLGD